MLLIQYIKDKKDKIKKRLLNGAKLWDSFPIGYVIYLVLPTFLKDYAPDLIIDLNGFLFEFGVPEVLIEPFNVLILTIGIAIIITSYKLISDFFYHRKTLKFIHSGSCQLLLEKGFENNNDGYLIGKYNETQIRLQVKKDSKYFNTFLLFEFAKEKEELISPNTDIFLFHQDSFIEFTMISDGDGGSEEVVRKIEIKQFPNSNPVIIFIDAVAGNRDGFATQESVTHRIEKMINSIEELGYFPISPIEMEGMKLHQYLEKLSWHLIEAR